MSEIMKMHPYELELFAMLITEDIERAQSESERGGGYDLSNIGSDAVDKGSF